MYFCLMSESKFFKSLSPAALGRAVQIRQKSRQRKTYLVSPKAALGYVLEFLLMLLLFSVRGEGYALALGMLAGLAFAKQNLAIISPLFAIAGLVFYQNPYTFLYVSVPPIALTAVYFVYARLRKNVPTYISVAAATVSSLPYLVLNGIFGDDMMMVIASAIIIPVFSMSSIFACYAVLIRGIKSKFTLDEKISIGVVLLAASYAAYALNVFGFRPFYLLVPFLILCFSDRSSPSSTLSVCAAAGLGAAFASRDISLLGVAVLWGCSAAALSVYTRFASAAAMTAAETLMWLVIGYSGGGWRALLIFAIGALVYCVLPKSAREKLQPSHSADKANAYCAIVNRDRRELSERLSSVAEVFFSLSEDLEHTEDGKKNLTPSRMALEIAANYCGRCPDREGCFSALGGDTAPILERMTGAALNRGKVTILDMPPFITSRCSRMQNLAAVINNTADAYRARIAVSGDNLDAKRLMSEHCAGVSLAFDSLSRECGEQMSFGSELEDIIAAELAKHNIIASEVVAGGGENCKSVTLVVRECDADKAVLPRVVASIVKTKLKVVSTLRRGEDRIVYLCAAPVFEVAYGVAEKSKLEVSGDSRRIISVPPNKRIFAVCDGMGSGERAARTSSQAVEMVEKFYRAGFGSDVTLSLINKLLSLSGEENFSALDIAVVDTVGGDIDIVKYGAASGFLVRRDHIEVIKSSQPPVGILDKVTPVTARYQMFDGDMLVMTSDGVSDVLDEGAVISLVDEVNTLNPQTLADNVLLSAVQNGASDDCTVIALRLIAV